MKLPVGKKTFGRKWVYKVKTGADGSVQRYKARLVAQGFTQQILINVLSSSKTRVSMPSNGSLCTA